jgi:hypothetical protein
MCVCGTLVIPKCQNLGVAVNGSWRGRASTFNERVDADASCVCFASEMRSKDRFSTSATLAVNQPHSIRPADLDDG